MSLVVFQLADRSHRAHTPVYLPTLIPTRRDLSSLSSPKPPLPRLQQSEVERGGDGGRRS